MYVLIQGSRAESGSPFESTYIIWSIVKQVRQVRQVRMLMFGPVEGTYGMGMVGFLHGQDTHTHTHTEAQGGQICTLCMYLRSTEVGEGGSSRSYIHM